MTDKYNAMFPVGFRCLDKTYGSYDDDGTQYWLIGFVAVIIFFILAILFESLLQSLAITMLIPVSFIGLFLTYYVTGVPFGTGGFAAMVFHIPFPSCCNKIGWIFIGGKVISFNVI